MSDTALFCKGEQIKRSREVFMRKIGDAEEYDV